MLSVLEQLTARPQLTDLSLNDLNDTDSRDEGVSRSSERTRLGRICKSISAMTLKNTESSDEMLCQKSIKIKNVSLFEKVSSISKTLFSGQTQQEMQVHATNTANCLHIMRRDAHQCLSSIRWNTTNTQKMKKYDGKRVFHPVAANGPLVFNCDHSNTIQLTADQDAS